MDSIIFDVDGTLWNSTEIIADAWTEYLNTVEKINIIITPSRLMELFGRPLPEIAQNIFPFLEEKEQLRVIDACCEAEHVALLKKCAPLYEGLEDALKLLSQKYPLYIVSNCQAGYIEVFLESTGFKKYFKDHLCFGDTNLPKSDTILKLIDRNKLNAPVYVGDTDGDHNACKKAGVPFIFASYGFGETASPDYIIRKPMDLVEICKL